MIFKNGQIDWKLAKILFIDEISLFSIADFKKLDRYLRHLMAQFNSDALKLPFGGLQIVFCLAAFETHHFLLEIVRL